MYKVLILGAGPAGIFAALGLEELGVKCIGLVDKHPFPYSSGGLINDGKLNFDYRIGLDSEELDISEDTTKNLVDKVKSILIGFDKCIKVTDKDGGKDWKQRASNQNVKLIIPEQYHYGTDNGKDIAKYLLGQLKHTTLLHGTEIRGIRSVEGGVIFDECFSEVAVIAPGRSNSYWFRDIARKIGIDVSFGPIDIGVRVELAKAIADPLTDEIYDPKFIFSPKRHKNDAVRTFCTNPGGRVRTENYNGFKVVNGDSLFKIKTNNTNFALLNTIRLTEPFSDSTVFGRRIAEQFNLLGDGKPIVQRVGDFREGHRSRCETFDSRSLHFDTVKATLPCTPGDITFGFPARIVDNLWECLKTLDKILPGVLHPSTLLYAPEIKFYDVRYKTKNLETNVPRIFVAGDGCGKSRGIVGAAVSGLVAAKAIKEKYL